MDKFQCPLLPAKQTLHERLKIASTKTLS